jgi:hypothetical protein
MESMTIQEQIIEQTNRYAIELLINRKYTIIEDYNNGHISYSIYEEMLCSIDEDLCALSNVDINSLFD